MATNKKKKEEPFKKIEADVKKDQRAEKEVQNELIEIQERIKELEKAIPMFEKMYAEYKNPETNRYYDPYTGEDKTDYYNSILAGKRAELESCKDKFNSCKFELETLKRQTKKVYKDTKLLKKAEIIRPEDKKELRADEKKIKRKIHRTDDRVDYAQNAVETSGSKIETDPTKAVDIGDAIKASLKNPSQQINNTNVQNLGLIGQMGLNRGINMQKVSTSQILLLNQIVFMSQHGQNIDLNRADVKELLNKPETAGILLKINPECLEHIPPSVIEEDESLLKIFESSYTEKYESMKTDEKSSPEDVKNAEKFRKKMISMKELKEYELEEIESLGRHKKFTED